MAESKIVRVIALLWCAYALLRIGFAASAAKAPGLFRHLLWL
jgi:hypothetical protein